jgi:hypothetical protein
MSRVRANTFLYEDKYPTQLQYVLLRDTDIYIKIYRSQIKENTSTYTSSLSFCLSFAPAPQTQLQ